MAIQQGARPWLLALAIVLVASFLTHLLRSVRTVKEVLSIPVIEIELRTGRLIVVQKILWSTKRRMVPLSEIRLLTIRSLLDPQTAATLAPVPPPPPGVMTGLRRMFRVWFHTLEADELARAERRKLEQLRFFGALSVEGDDDARMLVAEGYSMRFLLALADDLATRMRGEGHPVGVEAPRPAPEAILPGPPLARPEALTNLKVGPTRLGFTIEAPPLSFGAANVFPLLVLAGLMFIVGNVILRELRDSPPFSGEALLLGLVLIGFGVGVGSLVLAGWRVCRSRVRTFLHVKDGRLVLAPGSPLSQWQWEYQRNQIAAFVSQQRRSTNAKGMAVFVYDLLLLDHAMRPTVLLPDRPEAEVDWLVDVLHRELELGG
jgi:hypothetical protein